MNINASNATAVMSYIDSKTNKTKTHYLWIKTITQPNSLTGSIYQSKHTRHFYPRYFEIGNYTLGCITDSQERYQAVARFIRDYHVSLSNTFVTEKQARRAIDSRQYVTLEIPSEQIYVVGVPERIQLNKKGVFDPAPSFSFEFIILHDYHKQTDYALSSEIQIWYTNSLYTPPTNYTLKVTPSPATATATGNATSTSTATPSPAAGTNSGLSSSSFSTKSIMIQAGHVIPSGESDEPLGHEGQTGAVGEQAFATAVRDACVGYLGGNTKFIATAGTAWDASAGSGPASNHDHDFGGDLFVSVHYSVGTPGNGFEFGYTRGSVDGRNPSLSSNSAKLATLIAGRFKKISGAPPQMGDNSNFGAGIGDPSGSTGWGYYAWGSSQRNSPNNVNHCSNAEAAVILECGFQDNTNFCNSQQTAIGQAIYQGICDYYGVSP